MIDLSKVKWTLSNEELYAIEWFEKNGFSGSLDRQYISKSKFTVTKNGVNDKFELQLGVTYDVASYMEQYGRSFEQLCELTRLRAELARQRSE